ncbi:inositol polyphosphate multikinase IPK2-like [Typha angustifolia]|uniref:inositol polyphosphate multikinase IPK2-like n=1 Tax=Typha angustifolia TaxID=59011 RepID=UPI003C2C46D5
MLRPPEHQVAGHYVSEGNLGPLIDGSGLFYKPLQSNSRGENELAFYSSFFSHPGVPHRIRSSFFPSFHGTQLLPHSAAPSDLHPHLVLEDLVADFKSPSIIDVKIGSRTWYPQADDDYLRKCLDKDRESTSLTLGFRVSGVQISGPGSVIWKPERDEIKRFTTTDVRRALRRFVSTNNSGSVPSPDCALATEVYGGSEGVLAQLMELKAWFEDQTLFHFYSSSVLVVYEKRADGVKARVKMVDFAHVLEGDGVIDHNFLGGLCSLIKFVSEILTDPEESKATTPSPQVEDGP